MTEFYGLPWGTVVSLGILGWGVALALFGFQLMRSWDLVEAIKSLPKKFFGVYLFAVGLVLAVKGFIGLYPVFLTWIGY